MDGGGGKRGVDLDAPTLSDDKVALVVDRDAHGPPKLPRQKIDQLLATFFILICITLQPRVE